MKNMEALEELSRNAVTANQKCHECQHWQICGSVYYVEMKPMDGRGVASTVADALCAIASSADVRSASVRYSSPQRACSAL